MSNYILAIIFLLTICVPVGIMMYKIIANEEAELNNIINKELKDLTTFKLKEYIYEYEHKYLHEMPINEYEYLKYLACKKLINKRMKDYKK